MRAAPMSRCARVLAARPTPLVEVRPQPGVLRRTAAHVVACAAVRGPGGGLPAEDRRTGACRAGYRRAQDLSGPDPAALCVSSSAEGRTAGGSAYDRIQFFVTRDCGTGHRYSSASWSWRSRRRRGPQGVRPGQNSTAVSGAVHVDMVVVVAGPAGLQAFSERQGSTAFGGALTFQFFMVVAEGEVFKVYAKDRIQLLHPRTRLVPWMRLLQGVFALFTQVKKVRGWVRTRTVRGLQSMDAGGSWRLHGAR